MRQNQFIRKVEHSLLTLGLGTSLFCWASPGATQAAAGDLDLSFNGGTVTTDFFGLFDQVSQLAIQSDGRIVAAGYTTAGLATNKTTNSDFALARYESGIVVPKITGASVSGKSLIVAGSNFDSGAKILLNRQEEKTRNDDQSPTNVLIAKKAGKRMRPGDKLLVQNSDGVLSQEFSFPSP
jgi:hypothetical protein